MSTRRKFTKYLMIVAIIAMTTLVWGCKQEISSPIAVNSITVTGAGGALTVLEGSTLQMSAVVLPSVETAPGVTWSVAAGLGTATISSTGLLTGTGAGTVIVMATTNDSSAINGTIRITVLSNRPSITSLFPVAGAEGVAITTDIEPSFDRAMNGLTIISANFTVIPTGGSAITGTVSYNAETKTATFNPDANLLYDTIYTATVTTGVEDSLGVAMLTDKAWTFTTASEVLAGIGPALLNLRSASNFAILAKAGITNTGDTLITGNIGVSPLARNSITGFSEILSLDQTSAISAYVTGKIYSADMQEPTPSTLTTAIYDVETAYNEAAGRVDYAVDSERDAGIIGGQTFAPGIYKWGTVVTMATDITLDGGPNDVWIFQVAETLTVSSGAKVILTGGAQAKNIFWQVGETVTLGTGAHFEGTILSKTQIVLDTGASVHGILLAQTQVTLDTATVTALNE